jgi:anti-sigma regulatory factor (Ser/Thr protein kinase)
VTRSDSSADFSRTVKVKPETARLAEVRRFVEEAAGDAALDVEHVLDLKMAVSEACANTVEHAGRHTPMPRAGGDDHRGLGLPLMVALMDEVTFARMPGGGTTVNLL